MKSGTNQTVLSIYFTEGFKGDTQYLFQALGNIGAYARRNNLDNEVMIVIIADKILSEPTNNLYMAFVNQFEPLFNQKNSPYLRLVFMSEENLITRIQNRADKFNDEDLKQFIQRNKQKNQRKTTKQAYSDLI